MKGQERRYMKKLFVLLLFLFFFLRPSTEVQAEEVRITYNKLQGIVYNQKIDGELKSNTVTMFQMGDRIAYCIEPGVEITDNYYNIYTDWSTVTFSEELKSKIEKIGYYGYEYPSHQTNYYYIAAQELIWEAVNPDIEVTWTTGKDMTGDVIDISKEKEEILELVESHDLIPSFSEQLFKDKLGETIVLEDENGVLENYEISGSAYHEVTIDGNKLIIKLSDTLVSEETLTLTRKYYDDASLLVYSKGDSQKLASLRITTDKNTYIQIANEEEEIVEVPDTGYTDYALLLETSLVGVGLVLFKVR